MTRTWLRRQKRQLVEAHEEGEGEGGELNLVPYLDIVTNVIMFLMMTTTFVAAVADVNVTAPPSDERPVKPVPAARRGLDLVVSISARGFTVAHAEGVEGRDGVAGALPSVARSAGEYDYAALARVMRAVKARHPEETKVIVNADPEVPYEVLVATLDACRRDGMGPMFPDASLAAGIE